MIAALNMELNRPGNVIRAAAGGRTTARVGERVLVRIAAHEPAKSELVLFRDWQRGGERYEAPATYREGCIEAYAPEEITNRPGPFTVELRSDWGNGRRRWIAQTGESLEILGKRGRA